MTVCVAIKVHDCIVFSADSASTLTATDENGNQSVLNVYNNADKVFNLHRNLPLCAMTCGMGHIGGRSISSLAKELRQDLMSGEEKLTKSTYTVQQVAEQAQKFFQEKYNTDPQPSSPSDFFEFWVGGYGSDHEHGEIWKVSIRGGEMQEVEQICKPEVSSSIYWGGQGEAIARLVLGMDPQLIDVLVDKGIKENLAVELFDTGRGAMEAPLVSPGMPTIDTIRLARFLVQTTIGYFSFKFGSDIVGGVADIATVTKFEGFKWIERKHFYPENLNRENTGHVC